MSLLPHRVAVRSPHRGVSPSLSRYWQQELCAVEGRSDGQRPRSRERYGGFLTTRAGPPLRTPPRARPRRSSGTARTAAPQDLVRGWPGWTPD